MRTSAFAALLVALGLMVATIGGRAMAQQAPATPPASLSETQKGEVRDLIKDYLLRNPEIIQEALVELDRRQKESERQARLKIIADKDSPLFKAERHLVLGNPNGDVTLVEFFDYNCGYCKRAVGDLQKLLDTDKNLRIILKDFPVLGPGSIEAAAVSLALRDQLKTDKMWSFHTKLLLSRGQIGRQQAMDVAKEYGADLARLQRDMDKPEVRAAIGQSVQLADALGLTGTPSYVLGDDVVVGAVGFDELKTRIEMIRKCGRSTC
jgi:protein-disulfide isomerase